MYDSDSRCGRRTLCALASLVCGLGAVALPPAHGQGIIQDRGIVQRIESSSDRLDMTVNTSQILTLGSRIPRIQVNNPELLSVTALSATEIQLAAKNVGVTQINLWDEEGKIYTVDVTILGDAKELELALQTQFPTSSIKVFKYSDSLVLKGFVDSPDHVSPVIRLAEDYAPKVINNIAVGGVHQVMLKVKVMEVSRTKLRDFGFDFSLANGDFAVDSFASNVVDTTIDFGVFGASSEFFGFLDALEQNDLAKILSEPVLTTISGRPAKFHVGGEIGYPVIQPGNGLNGGTITVQFRDFGTVVDVLPIVLGNGNIRLEVRPTVSQIDQELGFGDIPGFRKRQVDTGVEMKAGQTLALAGLIERRTEAQIRGLPVVSKIPYLGVPFRRVHEEVNEIELLILVTPEYVDAMDPHQVPPCGPGMFTTSPSSHELYLHGYLEVPACPDGTCAPAGWPQPNAYGPEMAPADGSMQYYEPVPSGANGSQGILPPGSSGGEPMPPTAPQNGTTFNRLPSSPVTLPSTEAAPYQYDRTPTYIRSDTSQPADAPPGPIGALGYDVEE